MISVGAKLRAMKKTMIKRILCGILLLINSIIAFFTLVECEAFAWCASAVILLGALAFFYFAFISWREIRRVKAALLRNATMSNTYDKN